MSAYFSYIPEGLDQLTRLVYIVGFIVFVWTARSAAVSAIASRKTSLIEQHRQALESITKAVDALNDEDKDSEHVASIYALQGIAQDFPRERDRIMDFLAAYVRRRMPSSDNAHGKATGGEAQEATDHVHVGRLLRINAALRILGGSNRRHGRVNLTGADLSGADLSGLDFERAQFRGTLFTGATLSRTLLNGADLRDACLKEANLAEASLIGANLCKAKCPSAILVRTDLSMANCREASFEGAIMSDTILQKAIFIQTALKLVYPGGSNIRDTIFGDPNNESEKSPFREYVEQRAQSGVGDKSSAILWTEPIRTEEGP